MTGGHACWARKPAAVWAAAARVARALAPIAVEGDVMQLDEQPPADYYPVGPAYLATMGIPLVSAREFTRADNETAPLVAVVDETMAAQYWRGQDPMDKRFQMKGRWLRVVG